ncbi:MAG: Ig-like domain-containing protein [Candidatus Hodarchaeota archaeon]
MKKGILVTIVLLAFLMSGVSMIAAASTTTDSDLIARGVDPIVGVDAYNSYRASDSATLLATPASGQGHIYYRGDDWDQYKVSVSTGDEVTIEFTEPAGATGIDIYCYDTDKSRIFLKYNQEHMIETVTASGNGYIYFAIDADRTADRGYYDLSVTKSGGGGDTTPPTVTITNPANGATVSGSVSITADASDNVGVTYVQCRIDSGTWVDDTTSPYSWTWDTTQSTDGPHTIDCRAWDAAGNYADDSVTVTVDNSGGGGDNELTSGETVYSSLSGTGDTEMWTIEVGPNMASMRSVLNCGSNDYDLYGRLGAEPTTSVYDWRGYTTGGEDVIYDYPGQGTWYIMVRSYSGSGAYDLTVTLTEETPPEPWGNGGKYAIIVGISDYGYISDLSYCDEDATDWYNQLSGLGYECRVYGDGHPGDYPRYDGLATESVVRNAMQGLAAHAQSGDTVCFITSGHGSGNGAGSSYLCMWDCSGSAGCYYDTELAADVGQFASGVKVFVFIDHCYSGGMGPELMALSNSANIYCTTTCTEDGYGWDSGANQNGLWTYYFLDYSWQSYYGGDAGDNMEKIFTYAHDNYPYGGGDEPQEFDGDSGAYFYL